MASGEAQASLQLSALLCPLLPAGPVQHGHLLSHGAPAVEPQQPAEGEHCPEPISASLQAEDPEEGSTDGGGPGPAVRHLLAARLPDGHLD